MKKRILYTGIALLTAGVFFSPADSRAFDGTPGYIVGVGDVLEINVLQPDPFVVNVIVAPDGYISFPYIGNFKIQGLDLPRAQEELQKKLADGYLEYPVLTVYLKEVKSKKYLVSGEVQKPGSYPLEDDTTVLKAISIAGGFSKYGNASRVKVLRRDPNGKGYQAIKVNVERAENGDSSEDPLLMQGDMVVVSEGLF
jgi:polysaccharide export outer membrane protein